MNKGESVQSRKIAIKGQNLNYKYRRGSSENFISFLHGYPTSSLDYVHLLDRIPKKYHVIAHDHLGFGESDKPISHNYLLADQADLTIGLYESLGAHHVHIVAHDYGTSVATEIIARNNEGQINFSIESVTLCNGSMLIEMAQLRVIQRLLKSKLFGNVVTRLSTASTFHRNMKNIWFDKNLYHREEMNRHWELLISNNGKKVLPKITRYIDQRYTYYNRWIGGLEQSRLPFHILWAANDPVAVVEMAYKLDSKIQNSSLTIIEECGHYPMIEKGQEWLNHVIKFIDRYAH